MPLYSPPAVPARDITMLAQFGPNSLTNIPAALTEFAAPRSRVKVNLTGYTQARVTVGVTTAANAAGELRVQYATNGDTQSTWAYLDGVDSPLVNIGSTGGKSSTWVNIAAGAKADVWLRIISINGDGAADPIFGTVLLQVK